ncbi:MAG: DUF4143 domain-containing protein [Bacteroides sp.]|nr:DUF4143 domain-containing protein [Bacteroides sp.]MCM1085520.1 DUF4143 domain-containing protein [Bacteroides sp.]
MEREYIPRVADQTLEDKLDALGAVLIEGPKYCGKTMLACQHAKSTLFMADPETRTQNLLLAQNNISRLLQGDTPRLIDEWQLAPEFWDAVRGEVDKRGEDGQFILTGSAVPADTKNIFHSGAGRMAWLRLHTMSLWESGDSSGDVSLKDLFGENKKIDGAGKIEDIDRLAFIACRGGWPKSILKDKRKSALVQAEEYFESVVQSDISRADNVERNPELARRLMRSFARNQGYQTPVSSFLADVNTHTGSQTSEQTVASYLNALKKIFVIEDVAAWNPNLRSRTAIRTSDTRYFTDPSIATAALGLGPEDLVNDLATFGLILETLCIRDLRVYSEPIRGTVYHYRDKNGLECDAVVHLKNGSYGLVEIKLGGKMLIEEGAQSLKRLADKIDTSKMKAPSFLMVLTGLGQYAYQRPDGICVVPAGCLKP